MVKRLTPREAAKQHFQAAATEARKPFISLSAGVALDIFIESLELAAESGVPFSGALCGRATWQEGIAIMREKISRLSKIGWPAREFAIFGG
jgi:tagatose 1,6-diphosphate aldolase